MKKIIGLFAAVALAFGAIGCSNDDGVMTIDEALTNAGVSADNLPKAGETGKTKTADDNSNTTTEYLVVYKVAENKELTSADLEELGTSGTDYKVSGDDLILLTETAKTALENLDSGAGSEFIAAPALSVVVKSPNGVTVMTFDSEYEAYSYAEANNLEEETDYKWTGESEITLTATGYAKVTDSSSGDGDSGDDDSSDDDSDATTTYNNVYYQVSTLTEYQFNYIKENYSDKVTETGTYLVIDEDDVESVESWKTAADDAKAEEEAAKEAEEEENKGSGENYSSYTVVYNGTEITTLTAEDWSYVKEDFTEGTDYTISGNILSL